MWSDLSNVPPVVPLLVVEVIGKSKDSRDAYNRLKKLWPELHAQSCFYWENLQFNQSVVSKPTELSIYLDGGLNLFDPRVGCSDIGCRLKAARNLSRSLALIGDSVWLTDYLTEQFLEKYKRVTDDQLFRILEDALVLGELFPLIKSGVVKFRSPLKSFCKSCSMEFENEVEKMVKEMLMEFSSEFDVERIRDDAYILHTGAAYNPSLVLGVYPSKNRVGGRRTPAVEEAKQEVVYTAIRSALWVCEEASKGNGALFSNTTVGLAALVKREQKLEKRPLLRAFDEKRSIQIPWVTELSASQIVDLRSEASKALPGLRELLAGHLSTNDSNNKSPSQLIDELRFQAMETRNELENVQKNSGRYWKAAYATVGLGISAYGLGTDGVFPALSGLLPILHLIIGHTTGNQKEVDKLERRAGYVLVKAQDLLSHTHS